MGAVRRSIEDIRAMRRAGRVVAEMHAEIRDAIKPGVTTADLDRIGREVLDRRDATSNFLGYHGYPAVICASPNNVIVHGIPGRRILEDGDILSIDCGAVVDGWHGDAAFTVGVGEIDAASTRIIEVAETSLSAAIDELHDGNRLGDLGHAVQSVVEAAGFAVVRDYSGHGIGRAMHEDPSIPNHGRPGRGPRLKEGHVVAIEPMLNMGGADTFLESDGWTVVTMDGSLSAHVEHTIAVTADGPEILTLP